VIARLALRRASPTAGLRRSHEEVPRRRRAGVQGGAAHRSSPPAAITRRCAPNIRATAAGRRSGRRHRKV